MRDGEMLLLVANIVVKENIDIDGTRPIAEGVLPAERGLNRLDVGQQRFRAELRLPLQRQVEEARLLGVANRLCFVYGRDRGDLDGIAQALDGCRKVGAAVAQVRT